MKKLLVYLDGASRGNPGPSGIGIIITDEKGKTISQINDYIGETTNNVAEYTALVRALQEAKKITAKKQNQLIFYLDSELLVNQIDGTYRTKNENLLPLLRKVRKLLAHFSQVKLLHIPREKNKLADKLANQAINLAL